MKKLLIIGHQWPEPDSSAAGTRMMQLLTVFAEIYDELIFACATGISDQVAKLNALKIRTESIELNNASFDQFLQKEQPVAVLFDRFMTEEQFGWRVAKECPNALRILDTEDLHCLRKTREEAVKKNRAFSTEDLNSEIAKRELASIWRSDLTLMISKVEMDLLVSHFKVDPKLLCYTPFLFDPISEDRRKSWKGFHDRAGFVTIGNFLHPPNSDAVRYLKTAIWPIVHKEVPNAEMHVYGAYPAQKDLQLNTPKDGFYIHGRADNALEVISKARVLLAPLRFGAGVKGKLLDAMLTGTPSVTTSIGAEGISEPENWPGFVADEPEDFANAAIQLIRDEDSWVKAQSQITKLSIDHFKSSVFKSHLINKINEHSSNLNDHRNQNFIGSMLQFHTLRSTEFMSRWIEAKNRYASDSNSDEN